MKKGYKITIIVLAAVLFCGAIVYAVSSKMSSRNDTTTGSASDTSITVAGDTTQPSTTASTEATTSKPVSELLLGKWSDGAEMSGFEFFEGGKVTVTYVNVTIPILNLPVNGTYDGTYIINGDTLTTSFSIYTATIKDIYTFTVNENSLVLRNVEDGKTSTYMKKAQSSAATTSVTASTTQSAAGSELIGSWSSSDGKIKYNFKNDGNFTAVYSAATSSGIPAGAYSGVYILEDTSLTMQYTAGAAATEKFTCAAGRSMLTLTDAHSISRTFTRDGTGFDGSTDAADLLGKWMDGADMSGFEFSEDSVVTVTYVNVKVPVVNIPITGTYEGSYIVNGNKLSMTYSIYGNVIRKTYTFSISGDTLSLTDAEDGALTTYVKK